MHNDQTKQAGQAQARHVDRVMAAESTLEGGGFPVRRPFPVAGLREFDPFLLLDEMGPVDWPPNEAIGAPDHPHRGFETVTYMLAGKMQHRDSAGHSGVIGPGDVQWMTAGAGIVHSELPETAFLKQGGVMHGIQLWVNLPAVDKMMRPRYQEIAAVDIPQASSADGLTAVRVIAGRSLGKSALIDTRIPISYLHFSMQSGAVIEQPVTREENAFVYVLSGSIQAGVDRSVINAGEIGLLGDGDSILLSNSAQATQVADFLLLSGRPLNEPVARYGPFVMNNQQQIAEAVRDYRDGKMGKIIADIG
jgi:redox-sensitive bicupin YhaK (pirin superfamily)